MHKIYALTRSWFAKEKAVTIFMVVTLTSIVAAIPVSYFFSWTVHGFIFEGMTFVAFATTLCVAPPLVWFFVATIAELKASHRNLKQVKAELSERVEELARSDAALRHARDVLEQRVRERTLELEGAMLEAAEANETKSRFLANTSHELRTPLNAIIGFSNVIQQRELLFGTMAEETLDEYVDAIVRSSNHLLSLVDNVLDLSKVDADKFEIERLALPLAAYVDEAVENISTMADERNQKIIVDDSTRNCEIFADKRALLQIITNILSNAVKYSPKGTTIRLHATETARGVTLAITDEGYGMSDEDRARATMPFERLSNGHIANDGGAGLGLTIVSALVAAHGGEVELDSELGQGTTVRVRFPSTGAERSVPVELRQAV